MTNEQLTALGSNILTYCKKFNVPLDYLFEILEDQKVTPMIRGKAMEYNMYLKLDSLLPRVTWSVQKLNLNAQTGTSDEDISVTHRRTGVILKVESKSTVRNSFHPGNSRTTIKVPHLKVKCHRSRSNKKLESNDRYSVDAFDVIITNTTNSIYQGNTVGENLEVVNDENFKTVLFGYYNVTSDEALIEACENDWRFAIPTDIAEDGFLPRTPLVLLENDPDWKPLEYLEERLLTIIDEKHKNKLRTPKTRRS